MTYHEFIQLAVIQMINKSSGPGSAIEQASWLANIMVEQGYLNPDTTP